MKLPKPVLVPYTWELWRLGHLGRARCLLGYIEKEHKPPRPFGAYCTDTTLLPGPVGETHHRTLKAAVKAIDNPAMATRLIEARYLVKLRGKDIGMIDRESAHEWAPELYTDEGITEGYTCSSAKTAANALVREYLKRRGGAR